MPCQCQVLVQYLEDGLKYTNSEDGRPQIIGHSTALIGKLLTKNDLILKETEFLLESMRAQAHVKLEDQIRGEDMEVSDVILAIGLRFWINVINKQKIESIHSCKMVLDYLRDYLNDLNKFGGNNEHFGVIGLRRFKIKKSYVLILGISH